MSALKRVKMNAQVSRLEGEALRRGFVLSTARWISELAKELGVKERRFFKAVLKLAKHGIWLEAEDWRHIARHIDLSRHLDMVVDYVIRRAASGAAVLDVVKEIPKAVENAGKLTHIREVLSNLI